MESISDRFRRYSTSVYAAMYRSLGTELGTDPQAGESLGLGYDYSCQAWVIPERNARGDIIGLSYRYENGKKGMSPDFKGKQKRGLVYPVNQDYGKGTDRYVNGRHNWTRIASAGISCPVCGKSDGCLVSSDNPSDPSACICIRPSAKEGAAANLGDAGYLHILKAQGRINNSDTVLPSTELPILIVEGASDVLAAMSLCYVAIGRPSASSGMDILSQMPLSGREIWVIGENDAGAGREGMEKTFAVLRDMTPCVKRVMPPEGIKDLRAWYNAGLTQGGLADWVNKHAEASPNLSPNVLEDGQATTLAREFLDRNYKQDDVYTLRNYRDDWYVWANGRYDMLVQSAVRGRVYEFLDKKSYVRETANGGKSVVPIPMTRHTAFDVLDAMNMPSLAPVTGNPPCWLSKKDMPDPKDLIVFRNGILDVNEYMAGRIKMYDPNPDLFVMNTFPYAFDEDARSDLAEEFFGATFEKDQPVVRLMSEWFGYNCVPDMSMEKMTLFVGPRRSGKGTTADTLRAMLGADQCCSPRMSNLHSRFGCATMIGKLAAIISEAKTPRASEAAAALETLLAIVGQDPINIDRKHIDELSSVKLSCRITVAMNDLPAFSDHALALAARMNIIYFPTSHAGREDYKLKPQLEAEARSGKLINWALAGLKDLRARGRFCEPTSSLSMIEVLELTTSPVTLFVKDTCVMEGEISKAELYEAWCNWNIRQGRSPGMEFQFGRWLITNFPNVTTNRSRDSRGERQYCYEGIKLTDSAKGRYLK